MISIDWPNGVINVPKTDLTLIQSTPTEIREMDLNWFRLQLKDLEDTDDGMPFLKTHTHNTEVTLGGLTFARVIEILDPYTVTFEDGQYAVNLVGANSNVGDKTNVNQVSVRSQNSAGLISSPDIEFSSFNGGVTIDTTNGVGGTIYPRGTERLPVNNVPDALLIAEYRGFNRLYIKGDIIFTSGLNMDHFIIEGESMDLSTITINADADVYATEFNSAKIVGTLDGNNLLFKCRIGNLEYVQGIIIRCLLEDANIVLNGNTDSHFLNCWSGVIGANTPVIDMGGSGQSLGIRGYNGGIKIKNKNGPDPTSIDLVSGQIILDSTVTNGTIVCRGVGKLTDNSTGSTIVDTYALVNTDTISSSVWSDSDALQLIADVASVKQINTGRWKIDTITNTMTFYDTDGTTSLYIFDLKDSSGFPSTSNVFERTPQ